MNTLKTLSLVALTILTVSFPALAGPFEDGEQALDKGDYATAAKHFLIAAEQGDMFAQSILGMMYYRGDGVNKDDVQAAKWFKAAAEQGDFEAQRELGKMLQKGEGVEQNYTQAYKWLKTAAMCGDIEAAEAVSQLEPLMISTQIKEGKMLAKEWKRNNVVEVPLAVLSNKPMKGIHFMLNRKFIEALSMFRWSAEQGEPGGQLYVGLAYLNGVGESQDDEQAVHWIQKAAEQGYPPAQSQLALLYYGGVHGVAKDYEQAMKWFRKAARQGDGQAALFLGLGYAKGEGVPQNYVQSYKWVAISRMQGIKEADMVRQKLIQHMSAEEINEAEHLAAERK